MKTSREQHYCRKLFELLEAELLRMQASCKAMMSFAELKVVELEQLYGSVIAEQKARQKQKEDSDIGIQIQSDKKTRDILVNRTRSYGEKAKKEAEKLASYIADLPQIRKQIDTGKYLFDIQWHLEHLLVNLSAYENRVDAFKSLEYSFHVQRSEWIR